MNLTNIYSFGALVSDFQHLPAGPGVRQHRSEELELTVALQTYERQKSDHHDYTAIAIMELRSTYRALPPNVRAHVAPVFAEYGGEFSVHNCGMRLLDGNFKDRVSLGEFVGRCSYTRIPDSLASTGTKRYQIRPISSLLSSSIAKGPNCRGIFISLSFGAADSAYGWTIKNF